MQKATEQENLSEFMAKCMYKHKSVQKNKRAQVKFHKRIVFERIAPSQSRIHKLLRRNPRAKSHYIISCRNRKHIFFSGFFRHIEIFMSNKHKSYEDFWKEQERSKQNQHTLPDRPIRAPDILLLFSQCVQRSVLSV